MFEKVAEWLVGAEPGHIGFDDGELDAVMPEQPFGDLGRGGGLSLSVEAHHQDRLVMRSDFSSRPE